MRLAGLILAGGAGRRIGAEKALIGLAGQPLVAHVAARMAGQVAWLGVSANGDPARFAPLGLPVLPDLPGEAGQGPMAGVRAGLSWAAGLEADGLLTVATDTPFLPADLAARLAAGGGLAHASSGGRDHYTAAFWPLAEAGRIAALFAAGERRMRRFLAGAAAVPFAAQPDPFANLNTLADLAQAEARACGAQR